MVRIATSDDQLVAALALKSAGIKARIRKLRLGFRVVFEGPADAVAEVLNAEGFRHANGLPFERRSFDGNQAFVRYVA